MIKFIATDLDGTLLDDARRMPAEIFPLIERLCARGVLFAPASGRQYANLKKLFAPVHDKIVYICENGALIKYRDQTLHVCPIDDGMLRNALKEIRAVPHAFPLLCGEKNAYIDSDASPFSECARASYDNCVRVEKLEDVIGREKICKISVYDEISSAENCYRVLPAKLCGLRTILSGQNWCDVSAPEADKGRAMQMIRNNFSLKKEECAAFGDHMNDLEMLAECGHAYVTANAYPPLKEKFKNTVPSNNEGGVLKKIHELLREGI
jgi:hypothetical protein